jgi:hypothetical protein
VFKSSVLKFLSRRASTVTKGELPDGAATLPARNLEPGPLS